MPTSQPRTLATVFSIVQLLQPQSVIDLGVGHGKTGILLREFLDIMTLRYRRDEWVTKIYGIEAFAAYRNPLWEYAYDSVIIGDGLEHLQNLPNVDLILALDVWEHFELGYEAKIRRECLDKARWVLISTPKKPLTQADVFGNSFERHLSKWRPDDFCDVPQRLITCTADDWIILLSNHEPIPHSVHHFSYPTFHLFTGLRVAIALWKQRLRSRIS